MVGIVTLEAIPNQSITTLVNNINYELNIKTTFDNITIGDLTINDDQILVGQRFVTGTPFIPYEYLFNGNFIFLTENNNEPFYENFGTSQQLLVLTQEETIRFINGKFESTPAANNA